MSVRFFVWSTNKIVFSFFSCYFRTSASSTLWIRLHLHFGSFATDVLLFRKSHSFGFHARSNEFPFGISEGTREFSFFIFPPGSWKQIRSHGRMQKASGSHLFLSRHQRSSGEVKYFRNAMVLKGRPFQLLAVGMPLRVVQVREVAWGILRDEEGKES